MTGESRVEPTVEGALAEMHAWGMALSRREARDQYMRDLSDFDHAIRADERARFVREMNAPRTVRAAWWKPTAPPEEEVQP